MKVCFGSEPIKPCFYAREPVSRFEIGIFEGF